MDRSIARHYDALSTVYAGFIDTPPLHDYLVVRDGYPEPSAFHAGEDLDPTDEGPGSPTNHDVEPFRVQ